MTSPLFAPFRGWLIHPDWATRVIAGAYDAKTPAERRAIVDANPFTPGLGQSVQQGIGAGNRILRELLQRQNRHQFRALTLG